MASKRSSRIWVPTEHEEQSCLMEWWHRVKHTLPGCTSTVRLIAIPNGGDRHLFVAVKLKREGVAKGVPDLFLAAARGGAHGLWIELKRRKGGVVSAEQQSMMAALGAEGYAVRVCYGWDEARELIQSYLVGNVPAGSIGVSSE